MIYIYSHKGYYIGGWTVVEAATRSAARQKLNRLLKKEYGNTDFRPNSEMWAKLVWSNDGGPKVAKGTHMFDDGNY